MPERPRPRPAAVEARAPTRIDLAGGTIDLWPLYLLHDHPLTVNAAIDIEARARVETTGEEGVEIVSRDLDARWRAGSAAELAIPPGGAPVPLEFPRRLAAHFLDGAGAVACRVTTDCQAPAGSGLGGSSALGIALAAALDRYAARGLDPERLLSVTRAIETQVLRIPTGEQDYHPALRGGVLALHYTVEGTRVERLPVDLEALRRRTVLVFTGSSRSSGISNWDMMKRHLDGERQVRDALDAVILATRAMRAALLAADWEAAAAALAAEWEARRRLSPTVTTPEIDRLIDAARAAGALAGKVCGAGGGGCLVLLTGEGAAERVAGRVREAGARVLEFRYVERGVTLS